MADEAKTKLKDGEYTVSYGGMTYTGNAASLAGHMGFLMVQLAAARKDGE